LVQVIQSKIVETTLLEAAEKVFCRLDGESSGVNAEGEKSGDGAPDSASTK
jgi:hypothetical protein